MVIRYHVTRMLRYYVTLPWVRGVAWGSTPRIEGRLPGITWPRKRGQCGVAQCLIACTLCVGYPTAPGVVARCRGRGAVGWLG